MADVSSTYTRGDRVKVTIEGVVEGSYGDVVSIKAKRGRIHHVVSDSENVSIEPLPDPEPQWKHGAVVKVPGHFPFARSGDKWFFAGLELTYGGEKVSRAWRNGTLEILYTPED